MVPDGDLLVFICYDDTQFSEYSDDVVHSTIPSHARTRTARAPSMNI